MNDVWLFVKWQYSKLEFWQKVYLVNFFVMGFTALRTDETSKTIFMLTIAVPFLFMVKWFVIDQIISSWQKFKKEKSELFETIRNGK